MSQQIDTFGLGEQGMQVSDYILTKKSQLEQHRLISILSNNSGSKDFLAFAPDMAFFVLGFKDLLQVCKVANPKTIDDYTINRHCEEDSHHWLWYLEDIARLAQLNVKNTVNIKSGVDYVEQVWSDDNYQTRLHTYAMANLLMNAEDSKERLVLIDCLEASFSVFINALNRTTQQSELYEILRYFGEEHYLDEADHDQGSWLDSTREKKSVDIVDIEIYEKIDSIFEGFYKLFSTWYQTICDYNIVGEKHHMSASGLTI